MKLQKLHNQYSEKVKNLDTAIEFMAKKITEARHDNSIDVEDLRIEISNAKSNRQIYFQFTKDLEDLLVDEDQSYCGCGVALTNIVEQETGVCMACR